MRTPIVPGVARPPYGPLSRRRAGASLVGRSPKYQYQSSPPLTRSLKTMIRRRARELTRAEAEVRYCELFYALAYLVQTQRISWEEIHAWVPGAAEVRINVCTPCAANQARTAR